MIRILLVDDHKIVREGLRRLLGLDPELHVVGEAENGTTAESLYDQLHPDIVLMDITMPGPNGIETTQRIVARDPQARVVGLSMHSDDSTRSAMLHAGARAYLAKDCTFDDLNQVIHEVSHP